MAIQKDKAAGGRNVTLTSGSIAWNIFLFSVPLVCTNLLQVLFNIVDVAVIGRFAGSLSLGAVGSTPNLIFMFTGFLTGIGAGINVLTAYYIGAKDGNSVKAVVHSAAIFSLVLGVALLVLGVAFGNLILSAMRTKPELLGKASVYFRIYMLGMPAVALYNFGNAVFSATGDTKKPLEYLAVAGAVNVLLDLLFVVVLKMDVAGAAVATVCAQYISAFLVVAGLSRGVPGIRLERSSLRVDRQKLCRLAGVGFPSGFQNVIFAFANIFVQVGVNSFDSVMVAGNSASANIDPLIYNVMAAVYVACSTFIGQNYGAGSRKRVRRSYFVSLAMAFGAAFVMGTLLFLFGEAALSIFTNDSAVVACGLRRVHIMAFAYCVSAFMDTTIAASRGLGKTVVPSVFVFLGSCVFRIVWIYTIFAHFQTIESLFLLYPFSWGITAVIEIMYFASQLNKLLPARNENS